MAVTLNKRPLTVEQFNRMIEAGIIPEDDRVELIDGDIIEMAPIGTPHAARVDRVVHAFRSRLPETVILRVQSPVRVSRVTRVEPDVVLLRARPDFYELELPGPDAVMLVVEVADTSVAYDRHVKIPAYARANVQEAWLVDITTEHVDVYRQPAPDGYHEVHRAGPADQLSVLAFPGMSFPASRIVGPAA